jgi:hypothetical protein
VPRDVIFGDWRHFRELSDLFGVAGRRLLAHAPLDAPYRLRVNAMMRLIDALDFEIQAVGGPLRVALAGLPGFTAVQAVPGVVATWWHQRARSSSSQPSPASCRSW